MAKCVSILIARRSLLSIYESVFFNVALCPEANILKLENVEKYAFASEQCLSDMSQGFENLRGANCALPNPEVEITFAKPNLAYMSKIEIQRDHEKNPGNVRQFEVTMIDADGAVILDAITDKPSVWRTPVNEPVLRGDFRNIRGIRLKVLKTDNNENVRGLRIKITGCYAGGMQLHLVVILGRSLLTCVRFCL